MSVVFITGGAKRIGRGLTSGFAAMGWSVGVIYHTSGTEAIELVTELTAAGVRVEAIAADVANHDALVTALDHLTSRLGEPDVIVSNAGIYPPATSVPELTIEQLRTTLSVNTEPLLTIARWLSVRKEKPLYRLIAISSLGAFEVWNNRVDYNVSKSALVTLVRSLARTLAPTVVVNSVAPGAIINQLQPTQADLSVTSLSRIPMERYGTPNDVFDAVRFFATATPYITGQTLLVDGGHHLV